MVDTVKFSVDWPLRARVRSDNWKLRRTIEEIDVAWEEEAQETPVNVFARNGDKTITCIGNGNRIRFVQAELPKMLFPTNGTLIDSQSQLDTALESVSRSCGQIANTDSEIFNFRRVDLCLHFIADDPAAIIRAHRNCRYPRTNGERFRHYDASSASWDYSGRRFAFYDKGRQLASLRGERETTSNILRVEIQLRREPLKQLLGGGRFPELLDFDACYRVFRSELLAFSPPSEAWSAPQSKEQALAAMDAEYPEIDGMTPSQFFTRHMTGPTRRRWLRGSSAAHVRRVGFDWAEILPEDRPPRFISA